jgi:RNA polymerase sigma-70 factor (ECF subfamily)
MIQISDQSRTFATSAPDDSALVQQLRRGDEAAYASLVRSHGPRMLAVARRLLRDEEDARDAVQEAFLSAFRAIDDFRGGSLVSTWLFRIVTNVALMKLRSSARQPLESVEHLQPAFDADGNHMFPLAAPTEGPDVELIRSERLARLRAAIDRLPAPYRAVIVMRDLLEVSTAEAARALGVTDNAVKIRLHRARLALCTLAGSAEAQSVAS